MSAAVRITLLDTVSSGHHPNWVPAIAGALRPRAEVTLCVPERLEELAGGLEGEVVHVPEAPGASAELDVFGEMIERTRPDHMVHLYGIKATLREWLRRPPFGVPCTVSVNHPAALHYPGRYGTRLTPAQWANAIYKEQLVARWRRRPDAHAVLTMEEAAVERWARRRGAAPYYLPEPPVVAPAAALEPRERDGVMVYGALRPPKGVHLLADALALEPTTVRLVLAGPVEAGYEDTLERSVSAMRAAGVRVELDARFVEIDEVLVRLAGVRVLAMPYVRQPGTSRTLVEAAAVGTPVVAHDYGLLAHLVRRHGLGLVVDASDPRALRRAVLELADDPGAPARYAEPLRAFAELHSEARFRERIGAPFGLAGAAAG